MQIVYCFIEKYLNIVNQGFNFGSPFIFHVEVQENALIIHHKENRAYIDDLFKLKSNKRISNISAIVGENGTGKTNVLNFLRNSLNGNNSIKYGFVILMDNEKKLKIIKNTRKEVSGSVFGGVKSTQKLTINSVYYNPIYDFNKYSFITNAKSFDVSSNTLVRQDLDEDQFLSKTVSPIEFHELKNITRQVKFITSYQYSKKVGKNLNLPEFVDVVFINPNIGHAGNDLDNVPYNFKKLYTIGVDLWQEEQERIKIENHIKGNPSSKKKIERQYALNGALFYLWKFLFFTQEKNSSTLRKGNVKFKEFNDLRKLTFSEYIPVFLSIQNIFEEQPINDFITLVSELINKSKSFNVDNYDYLSFQTELSSVSSIMETYSKVIGSLSNKLLHGKRPNGFLQFNWRNLSSGERSFLDLFARLSFAKDQMEEYMVKNENPPPDVIYLFIDEGEIGFHLQWQKEYIRTIISIVPEIFLFPNHRTEIQIIFTTHSPISLSDIPRYNTVYLEKNESFLLNVVTEEESPKHSFGANIHEIMYDAFYLKDGFIGSFAKEVIDEIFAWGSEEGEKELSKQYIRKVIDVVDDPILRLKLEEIYAHKYKSNLEERVLEYKIAQMNNRLVEIKNDKNRKQ